ncbi:MAG: hypothetical protein KBC00_00035 [Candidatus Levybacteria bacterium]|nr:hypothetical protein [Candidatus Levybacteria bacterium]MBP9815236.1 hypothetical protein [Candidatus Levybacteria bacterium]
MKQNLIVGIVIIVILTLGILGIIVLNQHTNPTSGILSQNSKLGNTHEVATDQGKVIVGNPKSSNTNKIEPQIELTKWNEEVKMKVNYDIKAKEVVADENSIIWKGDKQDLIYKQIPAKKETTLKKIPKPKIKLAQNTTKLRYIKFEPSDLLTIAASYELFEREQSDMPTLTSYVPDEDGYFFFGYRRAELDLRMPEQIKQPIVRLKADESTFGCPVIPFKKNGGFIMRLYYPDVKSQKGDLYQDKFIQAINNALKSKNINQIVYRQHDFIYYLDGIRPVQIGRIGADTNNIIFYIYTIEPFSTNLKDNIRMSMVLIDLALPSHDLKNIKSDINSSFRDEVASEFIKSTEFETSTSTLTDEEKRLLDGIKNLHKEKNWGILSERTDIPKSPSDEEKFDKFEFDILLHTKPESNIFTYNIETDGLDFFYQPELTENLKDKGNFQPENVANSYAVYKKNSTNVYDNILEAEKYKVGKVLHIYRPLITASNGKTTWGELNIDTKKNILTITVNKLWLENASYPVLIDPTFGYTSVGAFTQSIESDMSGTVNTGPSTGTATSIAAYIRGTGTTCDYIFGLYKDSDSSFIIGTSLSSFPASQTTQWYTLNLTNPTTISAIDYIIAVWSESCKSGNNAIYYDNVGVTRYISSPGTPTGSNWPNPGNFAVWDNKKISAYVTYGVTKMNLKGNLNLNGKINLQ